MENFLCLNITNYTSFKTNLKTMTNYGNKGFSFEIFLMVFRRFN